jgi:hypothetical protein
VNDRRLTALFAALACAAVGGVAPALGCNGTGTTPLCTYPDGADDPEAGCGELVEAAALPGEDANNDVVETDTSAPDVSAPDAGHDATDSAPPGVDAADASDAHHPDAHDTGADSHADAKG